jgi:hypothetical protein
MDFSIMRRTQAGNALNRVLATVRQRDDMVTFRVWIAIGRFERGVLAIAYLALARGTYPRNGNHQRVPVVTSRSVSPAP